MQPSSRPSRSAVKRSGCQSARAIRSSRSSGCSHGVHSPNQSRMCFAASGRLAMWQQVMKAKSRPASSSGNGQPYWDRRKPESALAGRQSAALGGNQIQERCARAVRLRYKAYAQLTISPATALRLWGFLLRVDSVALQQPASKSLSNGVFWHQASRGYKAVLPARKIFRLANFAEGVRRTARHRRRAGCDHKGLDRRLSSLRALQRSRS